MASSRSNTPSDQPSADDVVDGQEQHMLLCRKAQQVNRSNGPPARSKGCLRLQAGQIGPPGPLAPLWTARPDPPRRAFLPGRGQSLAPGAIVQYKRGAQSFVASDKLIETVLQSGQPERAD